MLVQFFRLFANVIAHNKWWYFVAVYGASVEFLDEFILFGVGLVAYRCFFIVAATDRK